MSQETATTVQAIAAIGGVVVTVILAALTGYYAWATRGMLGEMKHTREQAQAPNVIAYAEPGEHGPTLVVRNIGASSAFGIRIVNRGPQPLPIFMESRTVEVDEALVDDLFLAPGQTLVTMAGITTLGSSPADLPPAQIECTWHDVNGRRGNGRSVVAFGSVMFAIHPGSIAEVSSSLRDIQRELAGIRSDRR